jgi:hypothetical protein
VGKTEEATMGSQTSVTRGNGGTSQIKKELRERDKDVSWKGDALKNAEKAAKHKRRPGADDEEKTEGLSVPKKDGK